MCIEMKWNNKSGVRCPEALIGVHGPDQPHLGPPTPPVGQEHDLSSALSQHLLFRQCWRGAGLQLSVHAPCWSGLWCVCGPPGLVGDLSCPYVHAWQCTECVWLWSVDWPTAKLGLRPVSPPGACLMLGAHDWSCTALLASPDTALSSGLPAGRKHALVKVNKSVSRALS